MGWVPGEVLPPDVKVPSALSALLSPLLEGLIPSLGFHPQGPITCKGSTSEYHYNRVGGWVELQHLSLRGAEGDKHLFSPEPLPCLGIITEEATCVLSLPC